MISQYALIRRLAKETYFFSKYYNTWCHRYQTAYTTSSQFIPKQLSYRKQLLFNCGISILVYITPFQLSLPALFVNFTWHKHPNTGALSQFPILWFMNLKNVVINLPFVFPQKCAIMPIPAALLTSSIKNISFRVYLKFKVKNCVKESSSVIHLNLCFLFNNILWSILLNY